MNIYKYKINARIWELSRKQVVEHMFIIDDLSKSEIAKECNFVVDALKFSEAAYEVLSVEKIIIEK